MAIFSRVAAAMRMLTFWGGLVVLWGMPARGVAHPPMPKPQPNAVPGDDCAALQARVDLLLRTDSLQVVGLADALLQCYQDQADGDGMVSEAQAAILLRIYEIGLRHDAGGGGHWLLRRAGLGILRHAQFATTCRRWATEAISVSPDEASTYLIAATLDLVIADYVQQRIPLQEAVANWAMIDRALLLKELGGGEDATHSAALREAARLKMRDRLPDCAQVMASFGAAIDAQQLPADGCSTFLMLCELQGCDAPALWQAALALAGAGAEQAGLQRLAGAAAFNRGDWAASRDHWARAIALEPEARLQAVDHLQIAQTWLAGADYRQARSSILAAMHALPDWGEPYIRLMDLYLEGSRACNMTAFERKGLYWLLMDLCKDLLHVDNNYASQANERLYAYKSLAPTAAEIAYVGYKPGDTYPLKCWMSTTTTVPLE